MEWRWTSWDNSDKPRVSLSVLLSGSDICTGDIKGSAVNAYGYGEEGTRNDAPAAAAAVD